MIFVRFGSRRSLYYPCPVGNLGRGSTPPMFHVEHLVRAVDVTRLFTGRVRETEFPMSTKPLKSRLGRGLSSLLSVTDAEAESRRLAPSIGESGPALTSAETRSGDPAGAGTASVRVMDLPLDQVTPNPHQPRREFN